MKETSELLQFIILLARALHEAKENDGDIDFDDASLLLPVLMQAGPALGGVNQVITEVKRSTPEEREQLLLPLAGEIKPFTGDDVDATVDDTFTLLAALDRIVDRHVLAEKRAEAEAEAAAEAEADAGSEE